MDANPTAPAPSAPLDTAIDHRSLLNVTSWFMIIATFITVSTRCGTRWAILRKFGLDDAFIIVSMLLAICTTVALTLGISNGAGLLDWEHGSKSQIDKLQKAVYSLNVLFVLSQSFSKVSVAIFIRTITPDSLHRSITSFICFGVSIWTITAVFGLLFQCHVPEVWNSHENICFDRLSFYTFVEVASVTLDLCLVLLPAMIAWQLQVKLKSKLLIIGCFASRILVIAATIVQLVILYKQSKTGDPFFSWSSMISTEVVLNLGIISACVPYLKPFLQSLNSGMIGSDDLRRRGGDSEKSKYASKTKSYSQKKVTSLFGSKAQTSVSDSHDANEVFTSNIKGIPLQNSYKQVISRSNAFVTTGTDGAPLDWEAGSQSSRANIIRQTGTFGVGSEHIAG